MVWTSLLLSNAIASCAAKTNRSRRNSTPGTPPSPRLAQGSEDCLLVHCPPKIHLQFTNLHFTPCRKENLWYLRFVSDVTSHERKPLRLASCGASHAKHWLSSDLPPLEPVSCTKCGHPVILPARIRNFEVREVVASGGMGTVYRAFDENLERMVAIKMLKREITEDKQILESFYREARATAALNHTNIIHVYSFDEHEGSPYIVRELADHGSLDGSIIRDGAD